MSFAEILLWVLGGLGVTLKVTGLSLLVAAPFAFLFGVLQHRTAGLPYVLVTVVIEFWRSSSIIILLYVFFYVFPVLGFTLQPITVAAMVLGCNIGAYGSQAVRGALAALPAGQVEAGLALGLRRNLVLLLIEIPQVLRTMLPIFGNEIIELVKSTANVSLITMADMTYRSKQVMQFTYAPMEIYGSLILVYVAICGTVSIVADYLTKSAGKANAR